MNWLFDLKKWLSVSLVSVTVTACVAVEEYSEEKAIQDVHAFFENYEFLTDNYDSDISELYLDDAELSVDITMEDGSVEHHSISGAGYKNLIPELAYGARLDNEIQTFSSIRVVLLSENRARITANRYVQSECFVDSEYYMEVERHSSEWLIAKEYQHSRMVSNCERNERTDALTTALFDLADSTNLRLPAKVDANTILDKVGVDGHSLTYHYRLLRLTVAEVVPAQFTAMMKTRLIEKSCTSSNLRPLLDDGAELNFSYSDVNGRLMSEVVVLSEDCP